MESVGRVITKWKVEKDELLYGYALGMHAFGLEEMHRYIVATLSLLFLAEFAYRLSLSLSLSLTLSPRSLCQGLWHLSFAHKIRPGRESGVNGPGH